MVNENFFVLQNPDILQPKKLAATMLMMIMWVIMTITIVNMLIKEVHMERIFKKRPKSGKSTKWEISAKVVSKKVILKTSSRLL